MLAIIALVVAAIVALTVLGFALHILFSPWLLLVAVAIVAWIKFRPSRSRQYPPASPIVRYCTSQVSRPSGSPRFTTCSRPSPSN